MLFQDTRCDLVDLRDELEHWVVWQLLQGKLALRHISWIGLPQDRMAIAGHDLARFESRPKICLDLLVAQVTANASLHLLQPVQDLLVGPDRVSESAIMAKMLLTVREAVQQDRSDLRRVRAWGSSKHYQLSGLCEH